MSKFEEKVADILIKGRVKFEREKSFPDLGRGKYRFDFYLPNWGGRPVVIEVSGRQHWEQVKKFQPTRRDFLAQQERDRRKISYCLAKGIDMYVVPYWEEKNLRNLKDLFREEYKVRSRWFYSIIK